MFSGPLDTVTNTETWVSDFIELIDDDTGDVVNILNVDIGFSATVTIRDSEDNSSLLTGSTTDGTIVVSENDDSDAGFQWTFSATQMRALDAGRYNVYVTVVENGITRDLIAPGYLDVLQGNAQP